MYKTLRAGTYAPLCPALPGLTVVMVTHAPELARQAGRMFGSYFHLPFYYQNTVLYSGLRKRHDTIELMNQAVKMMEKKP